MAKKNKNRNKENEGEVKEDGEKGVNNNNSNNNNNNNKKGNITVVLKIDLHCEGCANKVAKCIRSFEGVETVSIGDGGKVTVVGKVDPVKLREKLEEKTHKKVELISPQVKKENKDGGGDNNNKQKENKENAKGKGDEHNTNKKESKDKNSKEDKNKSDEKKTKAKEPPVTTAVMKVNLHCQGCIEKIYKLVSKTKGYEDIKIDKQKDLVTVTGAIDMKALAEVLKKHLKREVEIVPPKKEEKKDNGGEKANNGGGKEKAGGNGGGKKDKGGGNGGDGDGGGEGNKMQFQVGYPYPPQPYVYGPGYAAEHQFHYNPYPIGPAPQMFSDENPNACSVM